MSLNPREVEEAIDAERRYRKDLTAERDHYKETLESIRDHGTENGHECWALHKGDCADVFQETARAALNHEAAKR